MSRSGYTDDECDDPLAHGRWRGQVAAAIRGKRGHSALRELAAAMDAMPVKELAAESLVTEEGEFCTLGVLGQARSLDMAPIDPEDWDAVAAAFNLAPSMVREIVYENDESVSTDNWIEVELCGPLSPYWPDRGRRHRSYRIDLPADEVARQRWAHMREWVAKHTIIPKGQP